MHGIFITYFLLRRIKVQSAAQDERGEDNMVGPMACVLLFKIPRCLQLSSLKQWCFEFLLRAVVLQSRYTSCTFLGTSERLKIKESSCHVSTYVAPGQQFDRKSCIVARERGHLRECIATLALYLFHHVREPLPPHFVSCTQVVVKKLSKSQGFQRMAARSVEVCG